MPTATVQSKVKSTKQEIQQLKDEIRDLYPRSQIMRLEIGAKLLELQAKLAHYGDGIPNNNEEAGQDNDPLKSPGMAVPQY
jgi:hypothetical protein